MIHTSEHSVNHDLVASWTEQYFLTYDCILLASSLNHTHISNQSSTFHTLFFDPNLKMLLFCSPLILGLALTATAVPNGLSTFSTRTISASSKTTRTYISSATQSIYIITSNDDRPMNATRALNSLHFHPNDNGFLLSLRSLTYNIDGSINTTTITQTSTPPCRSLLKN